MKKVVRVFTVLLALGMVLTACGGSASSVAPAASEVSSADASAAVNTDRVLNERALAEISTFDPFATSDVNIQRMQYQIFDSLFYETADGTYEPSICTDYAFNDAGDELTMTIRDGVKFHNGDPVTAEDVAFSLNTAIASSYTSKVTGVMKEAKVVDGKVVLSLKFAFGPIIGCLVSANCAIVPKAVYEADPEGFGKNPVGAGPYFLSDNKSGESYTLTAFPDYWRGEAAIKTINCKIIPDNTAALLALESGEIDWMQPSQDYSDRQALIDNPDVTYYETSGAVFYDIGFNCSKGLFSDVRLRQAVAYAIDKEDLLLGAINGMGKIVDAAIVPSFPQYPEQFDGWEYNIEKAKQLMAEAGYPNGFSVTMPIISASNYTKPAEVIQAQLKKIGIDLKIETYDRAPWFEKIYSGGQYEITYYAHSVSVADADFCTYPYFHSSEADGKGSNFYNYKNPEMDRLLEAGRQSIDENERKDIYEKVAELVRDDAVCIPTYSNYRTIAAVNELKGVYADPMQRYYHYNYHW